MTKQAKIIWIIASVGALILVGTLVVSSRLGLDPTNLAIQASDNATDTTIDLFVKVVDERGQPLSGVACFYELGRFGRNWAWSKRAAKRDATANLNGVTGPDGALHIHDLGHSVIFTDLQLDGYSRLYDEDFSGGSDVPFRSSSHRAGFFLRSHGQDEYKSDPLRPAVFVMVKNGVKTVTTLPSAGGSEREEHIGGPRRPLLPVWPKEPSIRGVQYVPTTIPTSP